jgi:hypothetical protein
MTKKETQKEQATEREPIAAETTARVGDAFGPQFILAKPIRKAD